jgi:hypothetical protein
MLIFLTIGFGIILGGSSRTDIMAHWAERRCDFDVIISAFLYKPPDDTSSAAQFASNNFKFCIGSKTSDYLNTIFGALFEVLRKQMGAADVMGDVMKVLRTQLNTIYAPFSLMMKKFWNKFKQIGTLASRIFQHLYMAMKKAAATAVASIYVALSLQTAFLNGIDLVIKVIMIVLYIMIALAVIFFLPILPVMVFVFMATAGIESAFPGRTGGMGTVFCFAPDTPVILKDNTTRYINNLRVGDLLLNGTQIEAVIEVPGSGTVYSIQGIQVSGDHRIWSPLTNKWILVKEHPDAIVVSEDIPVLWTLITSDRRIPVKGTTGTLYFSDWEELPNTNESAELWDIIVQSLLNGINGIPGLLSTRVPLHAPCFDMALMVKKYQSSWVPLYTIGQGDWIMGENRWTQVIGVCNRRVNGGIGEKGNRITDGVWLKGDSSWHHPTDLLDKSSWQGINLITDSGTFIIKRTNSKEYIVRDFTEVGWMNLPETYVRVEMAMEPNKKDGGQESSNN